MRNIEIIIFIIMSVPKIIHQIWIGPKQPPINLMNTWKEKHPDFEYIFLKWNHSCSHPPLLKKKLMIKLTYRK